MDRQIKLFPFFSKIAWIIYLVATLSACQLVATFDEGALNQSYKVQQDLSILYQMLADTPDNERTYDKFQREYIRVQVGLTNLLKRHEARKKNEETIKATKTLTELLIKYQDAHKQKNSYKAALIKVHNKRLSSLMEKVVQAEELKRR